MELFIQRYIRKMVQDLMLLFLKPVKAFLDLYISTTSSVNNVNILSIYFKR